MTSRCKLCGKKCESDEALQQHYHEAHREQIKWCSVCGKGFQTETALRQHLTDKHKGVGTTSAPLSQTVSPNSVMGAGPNVKYASSANLSRGQSKKRSHRRQSDKKFLAVAVLLLAVVVTLGVHYAAQRTQNRPTDQVYGIDVGDLAPDIPLTLTNGTTIRLSDLRPHPVLLWFVATWCSSCAESAYYLNSQYYQMLHSKGVVIITVELYDDLNVSGPSISQFAQQYGGGLGKPGWFYATSDWEATRTYDPKAYLDVFYLINGQGVIVMSGVGLLNYLPSIAHVFS